MKITKGRIVTLTFAAALSCFATTKVRNYYFWYSAPAPQIKICHEQGRNLFGNIQEFDHDQQHILALAALYGDEIGKPRQIQAIVLNETLAGKIGKIGDSRKAFSISQFHLPTARFVIKDLWGIKRNFTDKQLIHRLLTDDSFAIRLTVSYYEWLLTQTNSDEAALLAYNIGIQRYKDKGIHHDPQRYVAKARRHIERLSL